MHEADLDEDVANTNAAYRKHLGVILWQETNESEAAKDDRSILRDVRRKLFGNP